MSTEELTEEEMVQAIYAFAAEQMQQGAPPNAIEKALIEKGLDQESASTVVANLSQMRDEANVKSGKKNMIFGALWCVGGAVITAATYSAASAEGGTYVVTWGAIIFGAIQFIQGLIQYSKG